MKYLYENFEDYFEETEKSWDNDEENYSMRLERFHEEFAEVAIKRRQRMIEWLRAAFDCGREKDKIQQIL